jgi:hypothetical protein
VRKSQRITDAEWADWKAKNPEIASRAVERGRSVTPAKKWSAAEPCEVDGIRFPSKVQRRVYIRLAEMCGADRIRLDVRMPLLAGSKGNGRVLYQTVDFCCVHDGKAMLWVDAKTSRKSREWERGMAMWRQSWPEVWLWDGIGDPPWIENHSPSGTIS